MEVNTDIHRNSYVILSRNLGDWSSESNCIFRDHDSDFFVITVTWITSWFFHSVSFSPNLFESIHTVRNIKFANNGTWVLNNDHDWYTVWMWRRNKSWCISWIVTINLNKMSLSSDCSLNVVTTV